MLLALSQPRGIYTTRPLRCQLANAPRVMLLKSTVPAKPDVHIGFWDYIRVGLPITLLTMLFGWAWLVLIH